MRFTHRSACALTVCCTLIGAARAGSQTPSGTSNTASPAPVTATVRRSVVGTLADQLTRHYVERGYVNSGARLDPAGVQAGVLGVQIVEGRLSALRFSGLGRLDERYLVSRLWPDPQEPLQLDALRHRG